MIRLTKIWMLSSKQVFSSHTYGRNCLLDLFHINLKETYFASVKSTGLTTIETCYVALAAEMKIFLHLFFGWILTLRWSTSENRNVSCTSIWYLKLLFKVTITLLVTLKNAQTTIFPVDYGAPLMKCHDFSQLNKLAML